MKIGIVAEGITDFVTLKIYLSEWLQRHGFPAVEIVSIQPEVDATSGEYGHGGWTRVKAWCTKDSPEDRAKNLFEPLFSGVPTYDAVIIQLDGDVVSEYAHPEKIEVPNPLNARDRGRIVQEVLACWLWRNSEERKRDPHNNAYCLSAAVRSLETWFVSALNPDMPNPEEQNPQHELRTLKPELFGSNRLHKRRRTWEQLAEETKGALDQIAVSCPHFENLLQWIDQRSAHIS